MSRPVVIIEKTITQYWTVSLPLVDSGEVGKGVCYIATPENLQRVSIPLGFIEQGDKWRAVPFDSQEYFLGSQQECVDWLYKVHRERLRSNKKAPEWA